jgi:exodeoxyribonuclease V alpha subunit
MQEIEGCLEHIIYKSDETGFAVARLVKTEEYGSLIIVGKFASINPGEEISCQGFFKKHPEYGQQFSVNSYKIHKPKDEHGIMRYLESGVIHGIGPTFAEKIVQVFGKDTLDVIEKEPDKLLMVPGLGQSKLQHIIGHFSKENKLRDILIDLAAYDISINLAQKIYRKYEDETLDKLKQNPYCICDEIYGIGFKTSDKIAAKLGFSLTSPLRVQAYLLHLLKELSDSGHTCYPEEELIELCAKNLEIDLFYINDAVLYLEVQDKIVRSTCQVQDDQEVLFVWLKPLFICEKGIAHHLKRLDRGRAAFAICSKEDSIKWAQETFNMRYCKEQEKAIITSIENKVHVITGGPGTGKSTITKAILLIFSKLSENILLAAPTGKAAKRMQQICKKRASTIHSLLEFDVATKTFKRGPKNLLKCDIIIVDEASMIDTYLMYCLLKAIPDEAHLIIIGDVDQLPSIGPGSCLSDILKSKSVATTRLFQIYRQKKNSIISLGAYNINRGLFPQFQGIESDFSMIEQEDCAQIVEEISALIQNRLTHEDGFDPIKDVQVLCPMRRGIIGIDNLNQVLQNALNPTKSSSITRFNVEFRMGDKVMQIKNNYTKNIFNGDVGLITSINKEDKSLEVTFSKTPISYDFSDLNEICLSYAVSVHKFQGSEIPCVIIPLHQCHYMLLQRNLLYTAITRGKQKVIILGTKKALAMALANQDTRRRYTYLQGFINLLYHSDN